MKNKLPIDEIRYKQLIELEEFTNAVLCISAISESLIKELFKRHKELKVPIDQMERIAWNKIKAGASELDQIAFNTGKDNYNRFRKSVRMIKFLMLELIARCDDSNMRVWQFYNLLKTYKLVYPSLAHTLDDERKAFEGLFGQNDNTPENG